MIHNATQLHQIVNEKVEGEHAGLYGENIQKNSHKMLKKYKKFTFTQIKVDATTKLKQMFELNAHCCYYQCFENLLRFFSLCHQVQMAIIL